MYHAHLRKARQSAVGQMQSILGNSPCVQNAYIPPTTPPKGPLPPHCVMHQRKRKSDAVDDHHHHHRRHTDSADPTAQDSPAIVAGSSHPSTWPQDATTRGNPKRPRIDTSLHAANGPFRRVAGTIYSPLRTPSDIEDIGIVVSSSDPGPSTGSLLRERPGPSSVPRRPPITPVSPVVNALQPDYSSPHIPPATPLINRQTLRELDLDVIIRNPVLREFWSLFWFYSSNLITYFCLACKNAGHDLLFDSGLQFRPRRKCDASEKYWNAVWEEVKTGCTCITIEYRSGKPIQTVCMCSRSPQPPTTPLAYLLSSTAYTIRMPSRVRTLLSEFLEVMLFVIQPLSNTAVYSNPNDIREQAKEHSQHAAYMREIFDPTLIYQELKHKVFDPSGLFLHIGELLKNHCAPMRDRGVDELMRLAQQPGVDGLRAFRACLDLLEQMKLVRVIIR